MQAVKVDLNVALVGNRPVCRQGGGGQAGCQAARQRNQARRTCGTTGRQRLRRWRTSPLSTVQHCSHSHLPHHPLATDWTSHPFASWLTTHSLEMVLHDFVCDADDVVPLPVLDQAQALKRLHNVVCRQQAGGEATQGAW